MSPQTCVATIRGLPQLPGITEINVRSGPGTNYNISFKGPVGMSGLEILEVRSDEQGNNKNGKVYQWFKLVFHADSVGWIRDDLLEIEGDCSRWGYQTLSQPAFVFALERSSAQTSAETLQPTSPQITAAVAVAPSSPRASASTNTEIERVRKASFRITSAFEGSGHSAYNNYDAGIVSYGLIQFTLASGSLLSVIDQYLATANSNIADDLRAYYLRIRGRDEGLRKDDRFRQLLVQAADEPSMQKAQDEAVIVKYWKPVVDGYVTPRKLKTPLAYALLFDMGVNFGTGHALVRKAEQELGVPPRSTPGENGITEEQLVTRVADLRKASHYRQAEHDKLPGLKIRGDFWVDLVRRNDWNLAGDDRGSVNVNGRIVQVRNP